MIHKGKGIFTPQVHVDIPDGTFEDELGRQGFSGRVTHLYHSNAPTRWSSIEGDCKPRAYNLLKTPESKTSWQPTFVLENDDCRVGFMKPHGEMKYFFRNADGDTLYFVHEGSGTFESEFGNMTYEKGDYIIVPKGSTFRFLPKDAGQNFFVIEATAPYDLPNRGLLGQHAQFDIGVLKEPEVVPHKEKGKFEVKIKRQGKWTTVTYDFHPLDIVGWKGDLYPFKLNIKDFRPVMSHRYHLAPSVHATFVSAGLVVCSFVPRPFESDPKAERVPFYHRNIDSDEVIFYHAGEFFSRKNIGPGMLTFHPYGIHHGPHPGAKQGAAKKTVTDEYAVMVDTFKPLNPTEESKSCEWNEYHMSWRE